MTYRRNSSSGSPNSPRGSGIRRTPPPPPPPPSRGRYRDDDDGDNGDDDERQDSEWDRVDGGWDQTPRQTRSRRPPRRNFNRSSRGNDGTTPFILALLGWFVCAILSVIALAMASSEMAAAKRRRESVPGMITAAFAISLAHVILMVLVILLFLVVALAGP